MRPYFNVRSQLSVHNELLMQGEKIVVPQALRENIVNMAHETHQGIVRTISIVRDRYWWPRMDEYIKYKVQHCTVCNSTDKAVKTAPAPLQPVQFPEQPWDKLGLDIVGPIDKAPPSQRFFIVLVDYHSKWPEAQHTSTATSATVISFLKNIFAREGLPREIVTDNGVQFVSREFEEFLQQHGIKHLKSSLYHPQSNGQVERFNRVLKSCLQLATVQRRPLPEAVQEYLEAYRRTAHPVTGQPPSVLLHGRIHRSRMDIKGIPTPQVTDRHMNQAQLHERVGKYQSKMKQYADTRRAAKQPRFTVGQSVRILRPLHQGKLHSKYTEPQVIQEQVGPATYRMQDGRTWNAKKFSAVPSQFEESQSQTNTTINTRRLPQEYFDDDDDDPATDQITVPFRHIQSRIFTASLT
ncbi:MAG: DDE-type integrase/transposase/recombinase, partial [Anaplasma sp.]|nr:DDE-type integrase/transposase/recombinase [Anaplasma sp.]